MSHYQSSADLHRGFHRKWQADADSWLERTLGRLAGTYQFTVNVAKFHRVVADQYQLLADGYGTPQQAARLDDCSTRHMQHGLYGGDACEGIVSHTTTKKLFDLRM